MKTHARLWERLISFENLSLAYKKTRRSKHQNPRIREFHEHWRHHLCALRRELRAGTYRPQPLKRFVLRDPKTRVISVSDVRDRVIHHALVNILEPIFSPQFIYDSHASQKGKGTLSALRRFDQFAKRISRNHTRKVFVLKCDIQHYFDNVNHEALLEIIAKRVHDPDVCSLLRVILAHHHARTPGTGMPLGNWTSQFLANVYLNELDQYTKHRLKASHYLRYVDDFVILHHDKATLAQHREKVDAFLASRLHLRLHPQKCRIIPLAQGVPFLGFRIFEHHKIPQRRNIRTIRRRIGERIRQYQEGLVAASDVLGTLTGWTGYAGHGATYSLRKKFQEETIAILTVSRRSMPAAVG